jgi:hypothetical protein
MKVRTILNIRLTEDLLEITGANFDEVVWNVFAFPSSVEGDDVEELWATGLTN